MAWKASDERLTQKTFAEAADTTEDTLGNWLRDLKEQVAETEQLGG